MNMGKLIASGAICCLLGACVSTTTGARQPQSDNHDAANINMSLGAKYFQSGSYALARDRLLLAVELNPKLAPAYSTLGMTYEALDNIRLATEAYENSVRVAPRDINVQNSYAVFLCRQKEYEKAVRHFDKAINHPENDNAHVTLTNAGMCVTQKPDAVRAENYFRAAVERKPGYGDALIQLCLLKYGQKDYMGARAFLQRFMSTNKSTAGVLYLASRIEDLLDNDRGRTEYEDQLLRDFPQSAEAKKVLGAS